MHTCLSPTVFIGLLNAFMLCKGTFFYLKSVLHLLSPNPISELLEPTPRNNTPFCLHSYPIKRDHLGFHLAYLLMYWQRGFLQASLPQPSPGGLGLGLGMTVSRCRGLGPGVGNELDNGLGTVIGLDTVTGLDTVGRLGADTRLGSGLV